MTLFIVKSGKGLSRSLSREGSITTLPDIGHLFQIIHICLFAVHYCLTKDECVLSFFFDLCR